MYTNSLNPGNNQMSLGPLVCLLEGELKKYLMDFI